MNQKNTQKIGQIKIRGIMAPMRLHAALLVCLGPSLVFSAGPKKLGLSKEDECTEAKAPATAQASKDRALSLALLWALEPAPLEIRTQAIEDLGLLGDPRALNALAQLSTDFNPLIARAAVRAVGLMRHERAEEILSNIVRHPTIPEGIKVAALSQLPFQNTWRAIRTIRQLASTGSNNPAQLNALVRQLASELPAPPSYDAERGAP
jgi:HEAT repeats